MATLSTRASSPLPARHRGFRSAVQKVDWLLRDGEYSPQSLIGRLGAYLTTASSFLQKETMGHAIIDVVQELNKLLEKKHISHIVIYGTNRKVVAASILLNCAIPPDTVIILSRLELVRESLIAKRIDNRLSSKQIVNLPDNLEVVTSDALDLSQDLIDSLYFNNRLIGPYQIDTDRYPFTNSFV